MKKNFTLIICLILTIGLKAQVPCTTNVSPANGSTDISPVPYVTLKWTLVPGAVSYNVYLSSKVPPTDLIGSSITDSFNYTNAAFSNVYNWYVVPIDANGNSMSNCGANSTSFITSAPPPRPVNDDCDAATDITSTVISASTIGATQSQPADPCGGYTGTADDDIWFQFTAKSTGSVIITLNCSPNFDGVLEIFKGDCGSLTSISCSDAVGRGGTEQATINALVGTSYKVRVYSFGSSLNDEGSFSVSSTGSALPILLVSFKGERVGNNNVLSWSTATELNNKGFNVQYSFNGRDFDNLSFVASKVSSGNSSSVLNYQYTDNKATGANEYYRLMQTDKDGQSNYSNVVMIKGGGINTLSLNAIYPNPAKNSLNLIITSPENKQINLVITDITGQTLSRKNYVVSAGGSNLQLDISNLPSGSYFIKAICSDGCQTATSKFVKE